MEVPSEFRLNSSVDRHCYSSPYELPLLMLVNSPKPTFPPAVTSPILSHTSGPRGHELILTGDSTVILTFAQWHHQRTPLVLARVWFSQYRCSCTDLASLSSKGRVSQEAVRE